MTFDDDFMRLQMITVGPINVELVRFGLEWPPPERLCIAPGGVIRAVNADDEPFSILRRVRMSEITDEQRAEMTHVCRGAEYEYEMQRAG